MILKAKHHRVIYPLFKLLTHFLLKRKFQVIHTIGDFDDPGKPVLVIANHISWWDGFWLMYLNLKRIHRKVHFMMLEEQLKKHWYFQFTGGFSVKKKSRSLIESLNYTLELLSDPHNMVFIFPQGEIQSQHNNTITFEQGVQRIVEKLTDEIQVVFVANLLDYFSHPKPGLYMYIETHNSQQLKHCSVESKYSIFYNNALSKQKNIRS